MLSDSCKLSISMHSIGFEVNKNSGGGIPKIPVQSNLPTLRSFVITVRLSFTKLKFCIKMVYIHVHITRTDLLYFGNPFFPCWNIISSVFFVEYCKNSKNWDTLNYHRDCPTNGIVAFYSAILRSKDSDRITNRVDTDQTAP